MMNGYERRKQKKVEQIYSAAFEMFAKYGFQKVSVQEVARAARVSPATIYNYFGTKEQLYADTLVDWMDKQLDEYECILDSQLSFPEKTKEIMAREAQNLKVLSDEVPQALSSGLGDVAHMLDKYSDQKLRRFFMKFVAMGKRDGYIHQNHTDEMMIAYFTMYKNELARSWGTSNHDCAEPDMEQWMALFFYGLVGGKPSTG